MFKHFCILTIFILLHISLSAKILAVFPSYGYSQFLVGQPLLKHLAKRGHEITLLSAHKPKRTIRNIEVIHAPGILQVDEGSAGNFFNMLNLNTLKNIRDTHVIYGIAACEELLKNTKVQSLINSNRTFDVVLQEFWTDESLMALASHFKAPLIIFCTTGASDWVNHLTFNPAPFSYVSHSFSGFSTKMTLWERAQNFYLQTYFLYVKYCVLLPKHQKLIKKYFPNPLDINRIVNNVSLILLNSHSAATPPYPLSSNMIEIGGFHIESEVIPDDLKIFLDDAPDGVLYFCMGTNIKIKDMGDEQINEILHVFSNIKQKVVWKFETEELPNKPNNVAIRKWLPQRAILAHPNVKVFISHCGLIGYLETVYFGKPLICIPVFVDQATNAAVARDNGIAIILNFKQLNRHTLRSAIYEVLNNKSYTENVAKRSQYFRDVPVKPMDLATYWIEFVIKHRGAPHLRNLAFELRWYQYFFIDILTILLLGIVTVYYILKLLLKTLKLKQNKQKKS